DRRDHLGVKLDRHRLQDCQRDLVDAGEKFRQRMAGGRGVKHKLRIENVLVAVRIERENAHAGAKFEVDQANLAANADEQIDRAPGVRNGRKDDALLEVEFSTGRVEKRINISVRRLQRVLDVIARNRVAVDRLAGEVLEGARIVDQKSHSRVERGAA